MNCTNWVKNIHSSSAVVKALDIDVKEVLVESARANRNNQGPGEHKFINELNAQVEAVLTPDAAPARHA